MITKNTPKFESPVKNDNNPIQIFIKNFNQLRDNFQGDPTQKGPEFVQELLSSGKMSQEQWQDIVNKANALRGYIN